MHLSIQNYLFLSHCIPLPLSALKIIEENPSHPFYHIKELSIQDIKKEFIELNKNKNVRIGDISKKATNTYALIASSIFEKILKSYEEWSKLGLKIVPYFHKDYPLRLKDIKNPPKLLFIRGNTDIVLNKSIAFHAALIHHDCIQ